MQPTVAAHGCGPCLQPTVAAYGCSPHLVGQIARWYPRPRLVTCNGQVTSVTRPATTSVDVTCAAFDTLTYSRKTTYIPTTYLLGHLGRAYGDPLAYARVPFLVVWPTAWGGATQRLVGGAKQVGGSMVAGAVCQRSNDSPQQLQSGCRRVPLGACGRTSALFRPASSRT